MCKGGSVVSWSERGGGWGGDAGPGARGDTRCKHETTRERFQASARVVRKSFTLRACDPLETHRGAPLQAAKDHCPARPRLCCHRRGIGLHRFGNGLVTRTSRLMSGSVTPFERDMVGRATKRVRKRSVRLEVRFYRFRRTTFQNSAGAIFRVPRTRRSDEEATPVQRF